MMCHVKDEELHTITDAAHSLDVVPASSTPMVDHHFTAGELGPEVQELGGLSPHGMPLDLHLEAPPPSSSAGKPSKAGKLFSCGICSKTFRSKWSKSRHCTEQHSSYNARFSCVLCTYNSKQRANLKRHLQRVHHMSTCDECKHYQLSQLKVSEEKLKKLGESIHVQLCQCQADNIVTIMPSPQVKSSPTLAIGGASSPPETASNLPAEVLRTPLSQLGSLQSSMANVTLPSAESALALPVTPLPDARSYLEVLNHLITHSSPDVRAAVLQQLLANVSDVADATSEGRLAPVPPHHLPIATAPFMPIANVLQDPVINLDSHLNLRTWDFP
eukprot:m.61858 g.61858  ORF g.61858 m.61858 type:complete len:330 (+) comp13904_c0_seq1:1845-2834(+)